MSDFHTDNPVRRLRIVICWTSISGYMAACWSALHARPEVDLHVVVGAPETTTQVAFDASLMGSTPHTFVPEPRLRSGDAAVTAIVRNLKPDVLVVPGWMYAAYRDLPFAEGLTHVPTAMTMDTPYSGSLRERLGRFRHPQLFSRLSRVIVPGERGAMVAKVLGFRPEQIVKGMYSGDFAGCARAYAERLRGGGAWPKRFLYMGRYVEAKSIDILVAGYRAYRDRVKEPWPLVCMGKGELGSLLRGVAGIEDIGFVQPQDQPKVLAESGVFVLVSNYEPWGMVIVESCAAGLPIIITEVCGAAVELGQSSYNAQVIPAGDAGALTDAMEWMHANHGRLPEMGRRSSELAGAYAAEVWAERWLQMARQMAAGR